jgi:hypothetical protein
MKILSHQTLLISYKTAFLRMFSLYYPSHYLLSEVKWHWKRIKAPICFATGHIIVRARNSPIQNMEKPLKMKGHAQKKGQTISVTGLEGPYGCETSRFPRFLDKWIRDGGEAVSLTRRPAAFCPQEDSCYSFMLKPSWTPATVQLEV